MALEIELDIEAAGVFNWLKRCTAKALGKLSDQMASASASTMAKVVEEEYRKTEDLRTQSTLQTYLQGKSAGVTPERRTYAGSSMVRTGQLAKSVTVTKESGPDPSYIVRIKEGQHTEGDPADATKKLAMIAAQLEQATPVIIPMTTKMMAYLQLLMRGEAGGAPKTARQASNMALGQVILVVPAGRGVWARAMARAKEIEKPAGAAWKKHFEGAGR